MKIKLKESRTIKNKDYEPGDDVIVKADVGERLIEEGLANRVIEVPENRMTAVRFSGHRKIFQGSDGKKYVLEGKDYVELKE